VWLKCGGTEKWRTKNRRSSRRRRRRRRRKEGHGSSEVRNSERNTV
jgi:hypothetical protein